MSVVKYMLFYLLLYLLLDNGVMRTPIRLNIGYFVFNCLCISKITYVSCYLMKTDQPVKSGYEDSP